LGGRVQVELAYKCEGHGTHIAVYQAQKPHAGSDCGNAFNSFKQGNTF
jgi:hypothetical protein